LFDENAASHVAFGNSYDACLEGGGPGAERGANQSTIHIDCMVGHPSMNVDGITASGYAEPVMLDGEFVI
jgi:aminopeptidase